MSSRPASKRPSPAQLRAWQRARTLVRVHRAALEEGHVSGRIVGHSSTLVALARIENENVAPGGFEVVRRVDVTKLEAPAPYAGFLAAALRLRRQVLPGLPRIDLTSATSVGLCGARRAP